jgi:hypothetical protein
MNRTARHRAYALRYAVVVTLLHACTAPTAPPDVCQGPCDQGGSTICCGDPAFVRCIRAIENGIVVGNQCCPLVQFCRDPASGSANPPFAVCCPSNLSRCSADGVCVAPCLTGYTCGRNCCTTSTACDQRTGLCCESGTTACAAPGVALSSGVCCPATTTCNAATGECCAAVCGGGCCATDAGPCGNDASGASDCGP